MGCCLKRTSMYMTRGRFSWRILCRMPADRFSWDRGLNLTCGHTNKVNICYVSRCIKRNVEIIAITRHMHRSAIVTIHSVQWVACISANPSWHRPGWVATRSTHRGEHTYVERPKQQHTYISNRYKNILPYPHHPQPINNALHHPTIMHIPSHPMATIKTTIIDNKIVTQPTLSADEFWTMMWKNNHAE